MFRRSISIIKDNGLNRIIKDNLHSATPLSEKWDLLSAVCIERTPVIVPKLNEIEEKFKKLLSDTEYERSLKSDHEMRRELEKTQLEMLKSGKLEADLDVTLKNTAQDFADACIEERAKFKPASTTTEDDKRNNQKSLNRKLDKHLILLVKRKIGNKTHFILPQGIREEGETLRQTADRILKENCGDQLKVHIYGNAPIGFYKYKYPKSMQKSSDSVGAKLFFYLARYKTGQLFSDADYKWLDRQELETELPTDYRKSIQQFLFDE